MNPELTQRYLDRMRARLERMRSQLDQNDWAQLKSECHQLKGSAPTYGFENLGTLARAAEKSVATGAGDSRDCVESLITLMERTIKEGKPV